MIKGKFELITSTSTTISSLFDISDVPPASPDTYLYYDGSQILWKAITSGASIYEYTSGSTYKQGDLIVSSDYADLFVATKDFTATDLLSDISNGNIKVLTSSSSSINFKQYNAYNKKKGDTVTINLTNPNVNYDRLVFVLQKQDVSAVDLHPFSFDSTETFFNYNENEVLMDGKVHLKTIDTISTTKPSFFFEADIDLNNYKDVVSIDANLY